MKQSTTVTVVPRYVELAPVGAPPAVNTAGGALLRQYLAVLAFHFEQSGAKWSATEVNAALANLPGLLLQTQLQTQKEVVVTPTSTADGLAGILASEWGVLAGSPKLSSLIQPLVASLDSGSATEDTDSSLEVTLIVLQRPASGAPTLGTAQLAIKLHQDDSTGIEPVIPTQSLTVGCTRTVYTMVGADLSIGQNFVADLSSKSRVADLGTTSTYVAIPLA